MKKITALLLCLAAIIAVISLSSCGNASSGTTKPKTTIFSEEDTKVLNKIISAASWTYPPANCWPSISFHLSDAYYSYDAERGILIMNTSSILEFKGTGYARFDEDTRVQINGILEKYVDLEYNGS